MTQYGTWVSYGGAARIGLAAALLAAGGGLAFAGTRLPLPIRLPRPGKAAAIFMLSLWAAAIAAFLVCATIYVLQSRSAYRLVKLAFASPIAPVTVIGMLAIFFVISVTSPYNSRARLVSAAVGAMAAPMIFEFPFDLIVMARTYPPIPPDPAGYRALLFVPLFAVEFTTLSLLTLYPMAKLTRGVFFFFALMLIVFAVWGLFGFGYPSAPLPIALNGLSKLLACATALSLFLPGRFTEGAKWPGRSSKQTQLSAMTAARTKVRPPQGRSDGALGPHDGGPDAHL